MNSGIVEVLGLPDRERGASRDQRKNHVEGRHQWNELS